MLIMKLFSLNEETLMEGSRAQTFDINNENLRKLQKEGITESKGMVHIDYFGHSCHRITSPKGMSILIDPWRNDAAWGLWFPKDFPEITVDLALSTHAHFDHDALHLPKARMTMERPIGTFTLADVRITGLGDKHLSHSVGKTRWTDVQKDFNENFAPPNNNMHMDNCIVVVECGGVTVVHWGDNRPNPDAWVKKYLKSLDIDVLIIPVDESEHILTYSQADEIMKTYFPALTIPMHYLLHGANTVLSTLQPAEPWVRTHSAVMDIGSHRLSLEKNQHEKNGKCVAYFGNHFTSK